MGDLLDGYQPVRAWDEMFSDIDAPRAHYAALHTVLGTLSRDDFEVRCAARDRAFRDQGITFQLSGEEERPFPLDLVPRIIDADEWTVVDAGVRQRVLALERFLADVYGPGEILADGVVPRRLVVTLDALPPRASPGSTPPAGCASTWPASTSCATTPASFRVLEDNLRTPSGISYVIENRRAMTHVFPELFASHRVRPGRRLPAAAARGAARDGAARRRRPVRRRAHARRPQRGLLRALVPRRARWASSWSRAATSCAATTRVHAHDRRASSASTSCTAASTTSTSTRCTSAPTPCSAAPGIVNAARAGQRDHRQRRRATASPTTRRIYPYVPAMIEYYLGEEPILANVETFRLEDRRRARVGARPPRPARVQAGRRLGRLRPRDRAARHARGRCRRCGSKVARRPAGLDRGDADRAVDRADLRRRPDGPAPPRPAPVRGATTARSVWVVPGGLTRVALPEGSLVVNSSQGGGSKDTWVLANATDGPVPTPGRRERRRRALGTAARPQPPDPARCRPRRAAAATAMSSEHGAAVLSRIAESLYWIGRYTERAEDTARLLDVYSHLLLEDRRGDEASVCCALLDALGADAERHRHRGRVAGRRVRRGRPAVLRLHRDSLAAAWERRGARRSDLVGDVGELNTTHASSRRARGGARPSPGTTSSVGCATAPRVPASPTRA